LAIVRSPRCADLRHRCVAAEGAHGCVLLESARGATAAGNTDAEIPRSCSANRDFLGDPTALTGGKAFADRSVGNLARPYFPDGELGRPNGPLSRPIEDFSPFATGLQIALVVRRTSRSTQASSRNARRRYRYTAQTCTALPDTPTGKKRLANGIQIFPGAVPIYRGNRWSARSAFRATGSTRTT
jgi:hypothetical protein